MTEVNHWQGCLKALMTEIENPRHLVRAGALAGLDNVLREYGIDPEPVLAAHGLSLAQFNHGDGLISARQACALLESAARLCGTPHVFLYLVQQQQLSALGAVGLLLKAGRTLRDGLKDVERYVRRFHASFIHWRLSRQDNFDMLQFIANPETLSAAQTRCAAEYSIAQGYWMLRLASGTVLKPHSVWFRHEDGSNMQALSRFFDAKIVFNAEFDAMCFPAGVLDNISVASKELSRDLAQQFVTDHVLLLADEPLLDHIQFLIRYLLPTGQCDLGLVAKSLSCDKRTLQRRLRKEADTSFQALLDKVRFETATYYLLESTRSITEVAELAGFNEATNFTRAFNRRFGATPSAWRKARLSAGAVAALPDSAPGQGH